MVALLVVARKTGHPFGFEQRKSEEDFRNLLYDFFLVHFHFSYIYKERAFSLLPLLLKAGALPQPLPGISYARGGKVAPGASAKTPGARVVSGLDRRHVFETRVFDVYRFSIFDFFVPARFAQYVVFIHALGTLKRVLTFRSERVCRP